MADAVRVFKCGPREQSESAIPADSTLPFPGYVLRHEEWVFINDQNSGLFESNELIHVPPQRSRSPRSKLLWTIWSLPPKRSRLPLLLLPLQRWQGQTTPKPPWNLRPKRRLKPQRQLPVQAMTWTFLTWCVSELFRALSIYYASL